MSTIWTVIRNPKASSGKGAKRWPAIASALQAAGVEYQDFETNHALHAIQLTQEAIKAGARNFIAVGGDGTANEVANGILDQTAVDSLDIRMAQIPIGTGNDWRRTVGIPINYRKAAQLIAEAPEIVQDVGKVEYMNEGKKAHRYFINIAGMGYDAFVGLHANQRKAEGKGGMLGYMSTVLGCLSKYECTDIDFTIDGKNHDARKTFYFLVGICKYNGAGMKHCPDASYDDGLLDVTIIEEISTFKAITSLPRLFNGSFVRLKEAHQFTGTKIEVRSTPEVLLEVDGENLGQGPAQFSILPKKLRVIGR
jgi:YegS/Rv2252/BmrU family lipid kinase